MPSFDIVSELNLQEVDNAVNQAQREIATRFDFKSGKSSIAFDKLQKTLTIVADDDMKLRAIHQLLEQKMAKRGLDLSCVDYGKEDAATGNTLRQSAKLKEGIQKEDAKKITQAIKDSKLKVQAQIQDEKVRVTAKKIDDLQEVIQMLKDKNLGIPLQFTNMRS